MEKEQIVTKLTEVIHDVLPELDEVDPVQHYEDLCNHCFHHGNYFFAFF